jgi:hypothetical protein
MAYGGKKGWCFASEASTVGPMLILISSIVAGTAAFGLAAVRFGTDSRPGFDERRDGERFGALR